MALAATYGVCVCGRVPFKLTCAHVFDVTANWIPPKHVYRLVRVCVHPVLCGVNSCLQVDRRGALCDTGGNPLGNTAGHAWKMAG